MLELSIPQLGEDSKNVKDLVFTILSNEQPLSIIELTNKIRKNYNVSITYQGVRKAVDLLHKQNVLIKTKKRYSIDKKWVLNLKSYFDRLLTTYDTKTRASIKLFETEFAKEDYAVYTFNNLWDLDNFWSDAITYWAIHREKNEEPKFVSYVFYSFWFLINLGRETRLFDDMIKAGIQPYQLFLKDVPLNRWGSKIYKERGVIVNVVENKKTKQVDELMDMNILGDLVFQIKYPEKIRKKLKAFYEKYSSTQEMSLKEITQIAHEPCEIKFIIFRNPTLAKDLREKYLKMF
ncbi:hypothetical protein HOC35_06340 [Candidatus Woesearchaeota archaeon]|jgi:hypothetical protein|nr:hypothetical protein [Candidatus Woesearchaeota archaeon]